MADFYRTVIDEEGCKHCGGGRMWTIAYGPTDDEIRIGTSWGCEETANDVVDLMNMAHDAGTEATEIATGAVKEVDKLVEFFKSKQGDRIGRDGDYDNLSPAETAIRFIKKHL
jgi:hypothetical protein